MLDNRLVAQNLPLAYILAMTGKSFRDRILAEMGEQAMTKAELHRRSGVPYHAIDKFLKRANASTNADNAKAIANALGIKVDDDRAYEELRAMFYQLDEEGQQFVLRSVRGLLNQ